ncbi:hypothetical protein Q9Q95_18145 [Sphingomonas sp. DG1-23]|uniref:hypothetical protein n=1 Tax=Sphingomonas sp. DG1-23 TaxID=3068316 RepID=UPI00273D31FF|nr:hypothetical protein [Sphingomonas sp. DG1-23]MDP5280853.1 hypothetical protein [Sphingomonas sp. DG1-23]
MPHSFRQSLAVNTSTPANPQLPLCHVASCRTILDFIENGVVSTDEICDVFGEKLNYFFYGRAAYRPKDSSKTNVVIAAPAALIIAPDAIAAPFSVYPFDTGGFPRYGPSADGHKLTDFAMREEITECERVIERHWQSYGDYIRADLDGFMRRLDPDCPAVECYSAIVRDADPDAADDRRSSLEVTSLTDVPIDASNILGIVLPRQYADNSAIRSLQSQGVCVQKYQYMQQQRSGLMSVVLEYACSMVQDLHQTLKVA